MKQVLRTMLAFAVSVLLLSAVMMAKDQTNKADKTSTEHHSKLSKAAFWRHHNDASKNAKQSGTMAAKSKQAQPKQAQVKPAATKTPQANKAQVKPVSTKGTANKTEQKQNTTKTASASAKKSTASSAQTTKTGQKPMMAKNTHPAQKDSSKR